MYSGIDFADRCFDADPEIGVLGAVLLDAGAFDQAKSVGLTQSDFSVSKHQKLFGAFESLARAERRIDAVTVAHELRARGHLLDVTPAYLTEIMNHTHSAAGVLEYARLVKDSSARRRTRAILEGAVNSLRGPSAQVSDVVADMQHNLDDLGPKLEQHPIFNREKARLTLAEIDSPQELPRFIVDGLLPCEAGATNGPGGTGKSSWKEWELAHVALGRKLYGREILRPGPSLYITQEDSRLKMVWRLDRIIDAMALSRGERERVVDSIYIEDLEDRRVRFVESDERGNLSPTDAADQLIDQYASANLSAVVCDPLIFFSAGERHLNDGAAELMFVGRRISRALSCNVDFIHHCSIATSRDKTDDQYAGRSAAAIADNARFVRNIWPYATADGDKFGSPPPSSVTAEDIAQRRLLVLKAPKISDAPPVTTPIWIHRQGWTFSYIETEYHSPEQQAVDDALAVSAFLDKQHAAGIWHTANSLEKSHAVLGIPRNRLRDLITKALYQGWIIPLEVPRGHEWRHGARTHRLAPGIIP